MSVFEKQNKSHMESSMFFDGGVDIARYDQVKYPALEKITEKMLGFFWRPEEIDVSKDRSDFSNLTDFEKHIFTSNLKRQILLDSVQGRGPTETFMPAASVPEIEPLVMAWAFFETIHSRSYTHIIRNVYANPSKVFDEMLDIEEIVDCAKDISGYYDIIDQRETQDDSSIIWYESDSHSDMQDVYDDPSVYMRVIENKVLVAVGDNLPPPTFCVYYWENNDPEMNSIIFSACLIWPVTIMGGTIWSFRTDRKPLAYGLLSSGIVAIIALLLFSFLWFIGF